LSLTLFPTSRFNATVPATSKHTPQNK